MNTILEYFKVCTLKINFKIKKVTISPKKNNKNKKREKEEMRNIDAHIFSEEGRIHVRLEAKFSC